LTNFFFYIPETGHSQDQSSLFQCQQTQSGQVYFPNIPDFYFNHTNAADFTTGRDANLTIPVEERGTIFIFSIPPESAERNCSGRITAVEYCYLARRPLGDSFTIFTILSLSKNGSQFTVDNRFVIQNRPEENVCTEVPTDAPTSDVPTDVPDSTDVPLIDRICCSRNIFSRSFQLVSSAHWLGIVPIRNINNRLLAFDNSSNEFMAEQYQAPPEFNRAGPPLNVTFSVNDSHTTNQPFMLFRFYIGKYYFHTYILPVMCRCLHMTRSSQCVCRDGEGGGRESTPLWFYSHGLYAASGSSFSQGGGGFSFI
jgi:hypothetical protein